MTPMINPIAPRTTFVGRPNIVVGKNPCITIGVGGGIGSPGFAYGAVRLAAGGAAATAGAVSFGATGGYYW